MVPFHDCSREPAVFGGALSASEMTVVTELGLLITESSFQRHRRVWDDVS